MYSARRRKNESQGMKQEFEALYGITVNYVRMSSGEALARVEAEKDAPTFLISGG